MMSIEVNQVRGEGGQSVCGAERQDLRKDPGGEQRRKGKTNANRDHMIRSEYATEAMWRIQRRVHGKSIAAEEETFILTACAAYVL